MTRAHRKWIQVDNQTVDPQWASHVSTSYRCIPPRRRNNLRGTRKLHFELDENGFMVAREPPPVPAESIPLLPAHERFPAEVSVQRTLDDDDRRAMLSKGGRGRTRRRDVDAVDPADFARSAIRRSVHVGVQMTKCRTTPKRGLSFFRESGSALRGLIRRHSGRRHSGRRRRRFVPLLLPPLSPVRRRRRGASVVIVIAG